ncbi:MAG: RNA polymerase sigma factor [Phycisphaerae bacterium]
MAPGNLEPSATHASLFSRLRTPDDHAAWNEFEQRYRSLLLRYCRKCGLQHADADDVAQTVLMNVAKSLKQFHYDPQRGRFRDYLYRCVKNLLSEWRQRRNGDPRALDTSVVAALPDGSEADDGAYAAVWHEEWVAHHYRLALERIRAEFEPRNLELFDRNVGGETIAALAVEHGISEQAAYATRRRIRARLEAVIAEQVCDEDGQNGSPE